MIKTLLILIVLTANSIALSNADTVIEVDTPNPGDTSTTITYTTGTVTTTNNLVSQTWNDGSWLGTQFPDSSDLSENIFVTGKHEKYLQTTVSSTGIMTEAEIKQGFTSTFGVQARWWNNQASTFTMYQTALDNLGNHTKQSTIFEDTTNHNYQFNPYANTLIVAPNKDLTQGSITAGFNFNIQGSATYNGGHAGVDLRSPTLTIDYQTLSQTSVTTIEYCYEKNPPTCPGQEEIDAVEEMIQNIPEDFIPDEFFIINEVDYYIPETTTTYMPEYIELDEIDYYETPPPIYDLPDMDITTSMEDMNIETFEVEVFSMDATDMIPEFEDVEIFNQDLSMDMPDMPTDEYFDVGMPENIEMFDTEPMNTDDLITMFTNEPEIKGETDANFTEDVMGTGSEIELTESSAPIPNKEDYVEMVEEPVMMAATEPEPMPEPEPEFIPEEKPMQETVMEEDPVDEPEPEEQPEVEEQPSSEEPIADEPTPEPEVAEQEKVVANKTEEELAEPNEEPVVEEAVADDLEQPEETEVVEEKLEIKIDIAKIERVIKEQVTNKLQQITATLDVVNEILSREMIANQPDISSYTALNATMMDNRQLPGGNPDFFNQISLESYSKTIYNDPTKILAMIGVDPVVEHSKKMNAARNNTNEAYFILKALLEAQQ